MLIGQFALNPLLQTQQAPGITQAMSHRRIGVLDYGLAGPEMTEFSHFGGFWRGPTWTLCGTPTADLSCKYSIYSHANIQHRISPLIWQLSSMIEG